MRQRMGIPPVKTKAEKRRVLVRDCGEGARQGIISLREFSKNWQIPTFYLSGGAGAYGSVAGGINPQSPVWGKMNEWVLYKQYEDMYNRASGQQGGWEWLGGYNTIKVYPSPYRVYPVMVRYLQKRPDFKQVTQAMQEGSLAFAKIILGRIRSKISNPPGPNGGVQLDGQQILQEGLDEKKDWEEKLLNKFGDILGPSMG